jgi:hypothetical protein
MPSTAFNSNSTVAANLNNLTLTTNPTWNPSAAGIFNYDEYNRRTLSGFEVDRNYMFGYVFFRQVKDKTLKRGYFQKVFFFSLYLSLDRCFNFLFLFYSQSFYCRGFRSFLFSITSCHLSLSTIFQPAQKLSKQVR